MKKVAILVRKTEEQINEFIKDKDIVSIIPYGGQGDAPCVLIFYKERSKKKSK